MLNTGLALQKKHDSIYSRVRCFFISNWGVTLNAVKQELRSRDADTIGTRPGYLVKLVEQHQQDFCALHGITYIPAGPLSLNEPIRNCPACAQVGYHSTIFQWNWLTHCPVHRLPLSERCPTCRQHWPSLMQITQRHCSNCGWKTQCKPALIAESPMDDFTILSAVYDTQLSIPKNYQTCLQSLFTFPHTLYMHDVPPVNHPLFASHACAIRPQHRLPLIKSGMTLQGMFMRRFSSKPLDHKCLTNPERLHQLDAMIREKVSARIRRCIAEHCHQPMQIPTQIDIDYEGIDKNTNCYLYAYLYWSILVNNKYVGKYQQPKSRYFELDANARYPLIPLPMHYIEVMTNARDTFSSSEVISQKRPIPLSIRNLIYELDLWLCFKSILKYFDTLKSAQGGGTQHVLYESLPYWARPGELYSDGISVYCCDARTFILLAPRAYFQMRLDDMDLYE